MPAQNATGRRTAFVSGAAYGIGAASALALARDGCDVAVSELKLDDLAETVQAITAAGARAFPVTLDLRSLSSVERAMAAVIAAFGHLDALVNNAGVRGVLPCQPAGGLHHRPDHPPRWRADLRLIEHSEGGRAPSARPQLLQQPRVGIHAEARALGHRDAAARRVDGLAQRVLGEIAVEADRKSVV